MVARSPHLQLECPQQERLQFGERWKIGDLGPLSHLSPLRAGSIPLSWVVSAVPTLLFGKKFAHKDPILIKILDPLPNEIIGDLYYELHVTRTEQPEQVLAVRVPQHATASPPQEGDTLTLTFLMGQVTNAK